MAPFSSIWQPGVEVMIGHSRRNTDVQNRAQVDASFATILPASTLVPLQCDECGHEQNYPMKTLRNLPHMMCHECNDERSFSEFELMVLEKALKGMGYYLSK